MIMSACGFMNKGIKKKKHPEYILDKFSYHLSVFPKY